MHQWPFGRLYALCAWPPCTYWLSEPGITASSLCIQVFLLDGSSCAMTPKGITSRYTKGEMFLPHHPSTWDCGPQGYLFNTFKSSRKSWCLCWMMMWSDSFRHASLPTRRLHLHLPPTIPDIPMLFRKVISTQCSCQTVNNFAISFRPTVPCHPGLSGALFEGKREISGLYIWGYPLPMGGVAEIVTDNALCLCCSRLPSKKYASITSRSPL